LNAPRPVFIGGCGRSGTTLLGAMLGTHADCLATPESKFRFLPYRQRQQAAERMDLSAALADIVDHWSYKIWEIEIDQAAALNSCKSYPELLLHIVGVYGAKAGKPSAKLWIDHTPGNIKFASLLVDQFPEARLIHMVRDGRATAASVVGLDWGPNTVAAAAEWWVDYVTRGLAVESLYGQQRVKRVVYEQLVTEPEDALRDICAFLGIDYDPGMIEGRGFKVPGFTADQHALVGRRPDPARLEAWRKTLTQREIEVIESIAVDLLSGLGYEPVYGWRARRMTGGEKVAFVFQELYRRHIVNRIRLRRRIHQSVSGGERA